MAIDLSNDPDEYPGGHPEWKKKTLQNIRFCFYNNVMTKITELEHVSVKEQEGQKRSELAS